MERRRLLKLVGIMGASGLAGCSGQSGSGGSNGSNDGTAGGSGGATDTTGGMSSPTTGGTQTSASMGTTTSRTTGEMEASTTGGMNGSGGMNNGGMNNGGMGDGMNGSGGMNGSMGGGMNEMNGSGGMNGSGSMNGSGGMGGGMGGGNRNPKAGQVAYKSVGIGVDFSSPTKATIKFQLPEPVQCSIAYGESEEYGTLRADRNMSGPAKTHRIPITTTAGTTYNARLNLFDNALNALQTPNFTFKAPGSGSATRSIEQKLTYVETPMAESRFAKRPNLDIEKTNVTVTYRTKTPVLGAVQFQQGGRSTTRRDTKAEPHTKHTVTINGLSGGIQTQWAVGLIAPDASMSTTIGMAFQTK